MKTCAIEGCGQQHKARGYCRLHYQRLLATGSTELTTPPSTQELFWAKVDKTDGCWNWTGARDANGYGRFSKKGLAHRFSFKSVLGPIDDGMVIDHKCHNRGCVNPEHLRVVSQKQNLENQSGAYSNSRSGIRGVYWSKFAKKWTAFVSHNRKNHYVGNFSTIEEAEAAVIARRLELHTHNDQDRQQQRGA